MKTIIPNLWFDSEAKEAAEFYTSVFANSSIDSITKYPAESPSNKPVGSILTVSFTLDGMSFVGINGGSIFKPTPALSFFVLCESPEEVDEKWAMLSDDGSVMMELGEYPFSPRYGWCTDRYGFSWQLFYEEKDEIKQKILPSLLFTGEAYGKAEEAIKTYTELFPNSAIGEVSRYGDNKHGTVPTEKPDMIQFASFRLTDTAMAIMESGMDHQFTFNEAVSLMVQCDSQEEIDRYWNALSAVPEAAQCGWLKDKYGVSWQIAPKGMENFLSDHTSDGAKRCMEALLEMKKIDLQKLKDAYEGA